MNKYKLILLPFTTSLLLTYCASSKNYYSRLPKYSPSSHEIHKAIEKMDSIWEDSYNNCRLDVQQEIIAEDLEFYHDIGGLLTSKTQLIEALKNNICGKVKRELLRGSVEVYPIEGYGAVQFGYHRFISDNQQGKARFSRFVHLWKKENDSFRITRVYSIH